MKDFLKDVPDLDFLPKGIYEGVEVGILSIRVDTGALLIHDYRKSPPQFWVPKKDVSPIPELTHWEASDFHKWFAENGMEDAYVFIYRMWHLVDNISKNELTFFDKKETISLGKSIKAISKYGNLESTPCTKPIKS